MNKKNQARKKRNSEFKINRSTAFKNQKNFSDKQN